MTIFKKRLTDMASNKRWSLDFEEGCEGSNYDDCSIQPYKELFIGVDKYKTSEEKYPLLSDYNGSEEIHTLLSRCNGVQIKVPEKSSDVQNPHAVIYGENDLVKIADLNTSSGVAVIREDELVRGDYQEGITLQDSDMIVIAPDSKKPYEFLFSQEPVLPR